MKTGLLLRKYKIYTAEKCNLALIIYITKPLLSSIPHLLVMYTTKNNANISQKEIKYFPRFLFVLFFPGKFIKEYALGKVQVCNLIVVFTDFNFTLSLLLVFVCFFIYTIGLKNCIKFVWLSDDD